MNDEIERVYEEIQARMQEPMGAVRERAVESARTRLIVLQEREAQRFEGQFLASLNMPIDAGWTILARARALRRRLEGSASPDSTPSGTDFL